MFGGSWGGMEMGGSALPLAQNYRPARNLFFGHITECSLRTSFSVVCWLGKGYLGCRSSTVVL